MSQTQRRRSDTKMVPVPSHSIVPERDVNEIPVLETRHLGITFGGLKAVDDFNLTIGKTEIAGLIGPNGAGKTTVFNLLTKVCSPASFAFPATGPRKSVSMPGPWSCWISSICGISRMSRRAACPTARSAAWRSSGPWPRNRSSSSWTSLPPA